MPVTPTIRATNVSGDFSFSIEHAQRYKLFGYVLASMRALKYTNEREPIYAWILISAASHSKRNCACKYCCSSKNKFLHHKM
jgi:hypothetical protein